MLAPLLSEEALDEALQLQHRTLRSDGVADIIAFIDAVAERNLLDTATRKRLYPAYFEALKRPEADLPLDPWPAMQGALQPGGPSPLSAPFAPARSAAFAAPAGGTPVAPLEAPAQPAPEPAPPAAAPAPTPAPPAPEAPAEQQVFAALITALQEGVRQGHGGDWDEFRQRALALLPQLRSTPAVREVARLAWGSSAEAPTARWLIAAPEATLAELVNLTYVALCEALGPIDADRLLTEAVREAQRIPAARRFSPRRLV